MLRYASDIPTPFTASEEGAYVKQGADRATWEATEDHILPQTHAKHTDVHLSIVLGIAESKYRTPEAHILGSRDTEYRSFSHMSLSTLLLGT